jgi:hypothetical protein
MSNKTEVIISGHLSGTVRDVFLESLESNRPDLVLAGKLWKCTDILPSRYCSLLGLPPGSTYAKAAWALRNGVA